MNYTPENGLINAAYPAGAEPTLFTYLNCQALANWSGMEYAMAAFYLLVGRRDLADRILYTVDERYLRAGEVWNHEECGDHYYRPLSSWVLMQALSGFSLNAAECSASLEHMKNYEGPWFGATDYGSLKITEHSLEIRCLEGTLPLKVLHMPENCRIASIALNGESHALDMELHTGDVLTVITE